MVRKTLKDAQKEIFMITQKEYNKARKATLECLEKAGIVVTEAEKERIEVADFGLGDLKNTGLQILTYVNTKKVCAKELVLTPFQTCPEHRHPPLKGSDGKEETFRCRYGEVYLYVSGPATKNRKVDPPAGVYTVFHEIILKPGDQYTLYPDTLHWFKAGASGAVVSEFSTSSHDESDVFTDPDINRMSGVEEK